MLKKIRKQILMVNKKKLYLYFIFTKKISKPLIQKEKKIVFLHTRIIKIKLRVVLEYKK